MFVQSSTIMAILAVAAQVAVAAQPPACVIAAVNTESDPSDFETICNSDKATSYLSEHCGNNLEAAQSYFEDICKTNGHEISLSDDQDNEDSSSSSRTSSPSATASGSDDEASATATASITGSNTYGASESTPSASATGSDVATTTGAASSVKLGMDVLGMGALLTFGAMLAL